MQEQETGWPGVFKQIEWLDNQEQVVRNYLGNELSFHGFSVIEKWSLPPKLALWSIVGKISGWVITGDLPTDFLACRDNSNIRKAMVQFCARWTEVDPYLSIGLPHPNIKIGFANDECQRRIIAEKLREHTSLFRKWAENDEIWLSGEK